MTGDLLQVQKVIMASGAESATVLREGVAVEPADRFLAHLTAIERSPNTVRAYAHDLKDYFAFLELRSLEWDQVSLEDLDRFAFLLGGNDGEFLLGEDRPTAAVSKTDPMTPAIAPVTPSHHAFGQVAALFDDYRAHYGQPPSPQLTRDWLHRQLAQHQMTITAAIQAGQACGFITTTVMPASQRLGTAWSIRDLYIAPQHRRHGIARTLLQHVIDDARAAGALRVSLQTEAGNTPALTLYTAAGFQPDNDLALLSLTLPPGNQQDPQNTV